MSVKSVKQIPHRTYNAGEIIYSVDEQSQNVFLIHSGQVAIETRLGLNVGILNEQGMACSYSESLFSETPTGMLKIGGDSIDQFITQIKSVTLERNARSIIDYLRVGPEISLFKIIE